MSDAYDFEKPAPMVNRRDTGNVVRYVRRRPMVSLTGALIAGPKPNARMYTVRGTIAAVVLTLNRLEISGTAFKRLV
jgi:hypothetical protein